MSNLYLQMLATSDNEADAIAEAGRLATEQQQPLGVTVYRCGTKERVATVLPGGAVTIHREEEGA